MGELGRHRRRGRPVPVRDGVAGDPRPAQRVRAGSPPAGRLRAGAWRRPAPPELVPDAGLAPPPRPGGPGGARPGQPARLAGEGARRRATRSSGRTSRRRSPTPSDGRSPNATSVARALPRPSDRPAPGRACERTARVRPRSRRIHCDRCARTSQVSRDDREDQRRPNRTRAGHPDRPHGTGGHVPSVVWSPPRRRRPGSHGPNAGRTVREDAGSDRRMRCAWSARRLLLGRLDQRSRPSRSRASATRGFRGASRDLEAATEELADDRPGALEDPPAPRRAARHAASPPSTGRASRGSPRRTRRSRVDVVLGGLEQHRPDVLEERPRERVRLREPGHDRRAVERHEAHRADRGEERRGVGVAHQDLRVRRRSRTRRGTAAGGWSHRRRCSRTWRGSPGRQRPR